MMPMVLGFLFLFGSNGLYVATIEISNSSTCFLQHVTVGPKLAKFRGLGLSPPLKSV